MSEYRKQILLSGTVAIIIGAGLALGVLYLPQTSQSSTTNSPITSTTNIGTTMGVSTSVLTVTSLNTSGTRAFSDLSFNETGLPNGTYWQVSVFENNSGQVKPTTYNVQGVSSLLTLHIPNGTYGYSIPPTQGYSASPNYGSVTFITNASAVIPVQFYYTGTTTTSSCNPSDYSLNGTSSMINANSTFYIINISYNFA
ncbi:MAG: hypothetical protein M1368_05705, partial [Thaumarchaeota archaeon]|nr:hypothetical protein [Nitrososphaerota archaeon]